MDVYVQESTLKKNLIKYDLNINFTSFDQFLNVLQEKIKFDLISSIKESQEKLEETYKIIFNYMEAPSLNILFKRAKVQFVNDNYLVDLIKSGYFGNLIEEKEKDTKESTQINFYKLKLLNKVVSKSNPSSFGIFLHFLKKETSFMSFVQIKAYPENTSYKKSAEPYIKALKLKDEDITLSDTQKENIKIELLSIISLFYQKTKETSVRYNVYILDRYYGSTKENLIKITELKSIDFQ